MRYASTNIKLPKFGMVFYNNFLSIFMLIPVVIWAEEHQLLWTSSAVTSPSFLAINTLAGLFGFYLNFASLWCVAATSATTYAIVGSLNKIPILIMGFLVFQAKMTPQGVLFIAVATLGGFIYAYSKLPSRVKGDVISGMSVKE